MESGSGTRRPKRGSKSTRKAAAGLGEAKPESQREPTESAAPSHEAESRPTGLIDPEVLRQIAQVQIDPEVFRRIGQVQIDPEVFRRIAQVQIDPEVFQRIAQVQIDPKALRSSWGRLSPSFVSIPVDKAAEPAPADKRAANPKLELVKNHAPKGWETGPAASAVRAALTGNKSVGLVVVTADIRASTLLMKESVDPLLFALQLGDFVEEARKAIWARSGWFDKFTGDGFLAFWPYRRDVIVSVLPNVFEAVKAVFTGFYKKTLPAMRANSKNFPGRAGLAFGLDAGAANLVTILNDLAIVGPPVVGAVRMVEVAEPRETLANTYLGELLLREKQDEHLKGIGVTRGWRATKEYEPQAVYPLVFEHLMLPE